MVLFVNVQLIMYIPYWQYNNETFVFDQTFDECVEKKQPDCDPKNMWLQIPFFCGHAAECWTPGSQWALKEAKRNLVENYFLVGLTEEMEDFIYLLDLSLPR